MTNCAAVVAVIFATSFLVVTVWAKMVCKIMKCSKNKKCCFLQETKNVFLMFQAYYYKCDGPILPAPWGILVMHCMWNVVCSSWVFSNAEAQWSFYNSYMYI